MRIIVWNTARASDPRSEAFADLVDAAITLQLTNPEPDLLVLIEALALKEIGETSLLAGSNRFIEPGSFFGDYRDANTLRYAVIAPANLSVVAELVDSGASRPGLWIQITQFGGAVTPFLVMHAPSVTASWKPQAKAVNTSLHTISTTNVLLPPLFIVGDLNVDAHNPDPKFHSFVNTVGAYYNHRFGAWLTPRFDQTHPTRPKSNKALDWALVRTNLAHQIEVEVFGSAVDSDSSSDSDPDFQPDGDPLAKSDHEAIVLSFAGF